MLKLAIQAMACPHSLRYEGFEFLARRKGELKNGFTGAPDAWGWWTVDLWMLDRLIQRGEKNKSFGMFSINLSPEVMFHEGAWRVWLTGAAHLARMNPAKLVVEVSERTPCDERLAYKLEEIKAIGAFVALDDFDAQTCPRMLDLGWDILKIDWRPTARAARGGGLDLEGVVRYCKDRQVLSVLEGAETPGDIEVARDLGVDLVQGFGVHRPVLVDQ